MSNSMGSITLSLVRREITDVKGKKNDINTAWLEVHQADLLDHTSIIWWSARQEAAHCMPVIGSQLCWWCMLTYVTGRSCCTTRSDVIVYPAQAYIVTWPEICVLQLSRHYWWKVQEWHSYLGHSHICRPSDITDPRSFGIFILFLYWWICPPTKYLF